MNPVSKEQRIEVVDILRGFALLGILLVNMALYSFPLISEFTGTPRGTGMLDGAADFVVTWLAAAKFFGLFSFLFGLGMSFQMARFQDRGKDAVKFMVRRLLILAAFGLAHALFIWNGDILFIYGVLALIAVAFRNAKPGTLLIVAGILVAIPVAILVLGALASLTFSVIGEPPVADTAPNATLLDLERRTLETYRDGTLGQIFIWRAIEWFVLAFILFLVVGFDVEALFLLGLYFGKRGIFQNVEHYLPLFKKGMLFGFGMGLPMNFLAAWTSSDTHSLWASVGPVLLLAFGPVLTGGYISALVILAQNKIWRDLLSPLAAAGRMALTNYLIQSIVCTLIFYSYGLGLYGHVGAAAGVVLSVAIWLIQLRVSVAWFGRFQFGPMEWLWRTLSYDKAQSMRKPILKTSLTRARPYSAVFGDGPNAAFVTLIKHSRVGLLNRDLTADHLPGT
jgi:uncharacterized protein